MRNVHFMMNAFDHTRAIMLIVLLHGVFLCSCIGAGLTNVSAREVTLAPGAIELLRQHPELKEDGFEMRFRYLDSGGAAKWNTVDLSTNAQAIEVAGKAGLFSFTLPNGGTCGITRVKVPTGEIYQVKFSAPEVGIDFQVPVGRGNRILIGSPQNNAHDPHLILVRVAEQ
jgi:hypothetical protein